MKSLHLLLERNHKAQGTREGVVMMLCVLVPLQANRGDLGPTSRKNEGEKGGKLKKAG